MVSFVPRTNNLKYRIYLSIDSLQVYKFRPQVLSLDRNPFCKRVITAYIDHNFGTLIYFRVSLFDIDLLFLFLMEIQFSTLSVTTGIKFFFFYIVFLPPFRTNLTQPLSRLDSLTSVIDITDKLFTTIVPFLSLLLRWLSYLSTIGPKNSTPFNVVYTYDTPF